MEIRCGDPDRAPPVLKTRPGQISCVKGTFVASSGTLGALEFSNQFAMTLARSFDQSSEYGTGVGIIIERTFRMPLHGNNEVAAIFALQRFDDSVLGTPGNCPQSVADHVPG